MRNKVQKNKSFYGVYASMTKNNENGSYIIIIEKD